MVFVRIEKMIFLFIIIINLVLVHKWNLSILLSKILQFKALELFGTISLILRSLRLVFYFDVNINRIAYSI